MKTTFTLKTNDLITRYENYATAIENLANNLANALRNNETFETKLYFGEYIIQEVKAENGNITKYWTKESQKCPN
jgi:hypothetical protein